MTPEFTKALMRSTIEAVEDHWRMQLGTAHVDESVRIKLYEDLEAYLAKTLLNTAWQMGYDYGMLATEAADNSNPFDIETMASDLYMIGVDEARDFVAEEGSRG